MKKQDKYIFYAIAAIIIAALVVTNLPAINFPASSVPSGDGDTYNDGDSYYYTQPTAPPASNSRAPTSLHVVIEPNPITMGSTVYGEVVSDGYLYPVTIHAKHVGANTEQTFAGLISEYGDFYHSEPINIPGYWDFWATTDTGVVSDMPRLTVQGAMLQSSKTFFSRMMGDMTTTVQLFCHSSGSATLFANDLDASTSIPITTLHINSGGYASTTVDFSGWSLGSYELDFVVNGIKASDYGESVMITLGR